jgi:hypothetical protein
MKKTNNNKNHEAQKITRKQAIQKAGITALTAASVLFLSTKQGSAASASPGEPGGGWPNP